MSMSKLRLGLIGCGAVAEISHLPTVAESDKAQVVALVDKQVSRAEQLAQKFNVPFVTDDYTRVFDKVDAVIIALPNTMHAPVSIEFLKRGIHALVEKPMALSAAECDAMLEAARSGKATLAVGLVRRFLHAHQLAKRLISNGLLGKIESFDVREGFIYDWPVASDFPFRKESGGGVLADIGAHTLDTILWWLGDYQSFEYFDDNTGGVEADCQIHLKMKSGAEGIVELSRTRKLKDTAVIRGEKAAIEVNMFDSRITLQPSGADVKVIGAAVDSQHVDLNTSRSYEDALVAQLKDWIEAIRNKQSPCITGEEARRSVALIEACHKQRKAFEMPWLSAAPVKPGHEVNLKGKKVLVTGGTGFIGSRLVERLVRDCGADVRVLVRNFASASRIARFPVNMVPGDVTDPAAVRRAVEGCEVVFHCAYGNTGSPAQQREITVKGAENILKAALEHNVKRVVHVSTMSVYGQTPDGDLDESAPRRHSGEVYADSKLEAEKLAFRYFQQHGLPVSVIQPTIVYGPYSATWTLNPIKQLKTGRVILVEGGDGLCNAVYVDDVVNAILLAATREEAVGQAFLISAKDPVTWREFYGAYEKMLGTKSTIYMTLKDIQSFRRSYQKKNSTINLVMAGFKRNPYILLGILQLPAVNRLYRMAKVVTPAPLWNRLRKSFLPNNARVTQHSQEKPILLLSKKEAGFYRSRTHFRIGKAERLLGYKPEFPFERGIELTEKWGKFADLI